MSSKTIKIIGAGLAGSEAAWQCAQNGFKVKLYEMRPLKSTKAHKTDKCAELVCSNSFRGSALENAVGLLKEELKLLNSLIMEAALETTVPAGGCLAVDRLAFSDYVSNKIKNHPNIEFIVEEINEIALPSEDEALIIASGPLTSSSLSLAVEKLLGTEHLAFFDAISPIFSAESIDFNPLYKKSRYDKGGADYWNIPLDKEQYLNLMDIIAKADKYTGNEEVENDSLEKLKPFEGCMPIEDMLERGIDTPRFGPLKPKGLRDPRNEQTPYAVMQLRQDDLEGQLWSLVGMQTRMKRAEQEKAFRSLPGLENAEFIRYGSFHRNTFIQSPNCLEASMNLKSIKNLFFAGQITGVEGYVESTAAGLAAAINAGRYLAKKEPIIFPTNTAIGGLINYITSAERKDFQPMNVSFGLIKSENRLDAKGKKIPKKILRQMIAKKALLDIESLCKEIR